MLSITIAKIIMQVLNVLLRPLNLQVTWRPYIAFMECEVWGILYCPSCDKEVCSACGQCHRLGCDAYQRAEVLEKVSL
jgi:hypothetical protein